MKTWHGRFVSRIAVFWYDEFAVCVKNTKDWKSKKRWTRKLPRQIPNKTCHGKFVSRIAVCLNDEFAVCVKKPQKVENQKYEWENCHGRFVSKLAMANSYPELPRVCMMNLSCMKKHKKLKNQVWTRNLPWGIHIRTCNDKKNVQTKFSMIWKLDLPWSIN